MRFYIDYDDCLCETARAFVEIADRLFGKKVPYEQVRFFNLQDSFQLTDKEYEELMTEGHRPEILMAYKETPGAVRVINDWIDQGHEVYIITGRPFSSFDASRRWLDEHGLKRAKMFCLNKYGRDSFIKNSDFNLELEDYYQMHFDYAIEDSPAAFKFFRHLPDLKVLIFDRPWNQGCELPTGNDKHCPDWESIAEAIKTGNGITE